MLAGDAAAGCKDRKPRARGAPACGCRCVADECGGGRRDPAAAGLQPEHAARLLCYPAGSGLLPCEALLALFHFNPSITERARTVPQALSRPTCRGRTPCSICDTRSPRMTALRRLFGGLA